MTVPEIVWKDLTQEELELLARNVSDETNRRSQISALPNTIDAMIRDLKHFEGQGEGTAWVKPDNATKSYPKGWRTHYNGKEWKSTISGNIEEPGTIGWEEITTPVNPPEWVEPVTPDRAYPANAEVTHNSAEWVSTKNSNMEEPGAPVNSVPSWNKRTPTVE